MEDRLQDGMQGPEKPKKLSLEELIMQADAQAVQSAVPGGMSMPQENGVMPSSEVVVGADQQSMGQSPSMEVLDTSSALLSPQASLDTPSHGAGDVVSSPSSDSLPTSPKETYSQDEVGLLSARPISEGVTTSPSPTEATFQGAGILPSNSTISESVTPTSAITPSPVEGSSLDELLAEDATVDPLLGTSTLLVQQKHILQQIPFLPLFVALACVLFTVLFFGGAIQGKRFTDQDTLMTIQGTDYQLLNDDLQVVEKRTLGIGDTLRVEKGESQLSFFDRSLVRFSSGATVKLLGVSKDEQLIQLGLLQGRIWVEDKDYKTRMEIYAHPIYEGGFTQVYYTSVLGSYSLGREAESTRAHALNSSLYIALKKDDGTVSQMILPPFTTSYITDVQQLSNIYDLRYSKAKSEFKIVSYFDQYNQYLLCLKQKSVGKKQCVEDASEFLSSAHEHLNTVFLYTLGLRNDDAEWLRRQSVEQDQLGQWVLDHAPFVIFGQTRKQDIISRALLYTLSREIVTAITENTLSKTLEDQVKTLLYDQEKDAFMTRFVTHSFTYFDYVLPNSPLYALKRIFRDWETQQAITPEEQKLLTKKQLLEKNDEFYQLVFLDDSTLR